MTRTEKTSYAKDAMIVTCTSTGIKDEDGRMIWISEDGEYYSLEQIKNRFGVHKCFHKMNKELVEKIYLG